MALNVFLFCLHCMCSSTESISRDHVIDVSPSGLVTIAGGKWTTYRRVRGVCMCAKSLLCETLFVFVCKKISCWCVFVRLRVRIDMQMAADTVSRVVTETPSLQTKAAACRTLTYAAAMRLFFKWHITLLHTLRLSTLLLGPLMWAERGQSDRVENDLLPS